MLNMSREQTGLPGDFLLKQLENEIQAGFALIAAARRTLRLNHPPAPDSASQQVSQISENAAESAESLLAQVRAVTNQLVELRKAVDHLTETRLAAAATK